MSDITFDELEMDEFGLNGDAYEDAYDDDSAFDMEGYDDESTSAAQRRQRAQELARRRRILRAKAMRRGPSPTRALEASKLPVARAAVAAVRSVGLESKIQDDMLRSSIEAQNRRMARSELATVAGVVGSQAQIALQNRITELQNPYVRAILASAPLFLLSPRKRGTGATSFLTDPRFIGTAAALALAFAGDRLNKSASVKKVRLLGPSTIAPAGASAFRGDGLDSGGVPVPGKTVLFTSSDPAIAQIDPTTGVVRGLAKGDVFITATVDGVTETVFLQVAEKVVK